MTEAKPHIEMALKAAESFSKGGKLDAQELNDIIAIAERDGVIDQNEVRVLRNIIAQVDPAEVDPVMRSKLSGLLDKISRSAQ